MNNTVFHFVRSWNIISDCITIIVNRKILVRIHLCLAHMSEEGLEQKFIKEAFDTNRVVPLGPNVSDDDVDCIKKAIAK